MIFCLIPLLLLRIYIPDGQLPILSLVVELMLPLHTVMPEVECIVSNWYSPVCG